MRHGTRYAYNDHDCRCEICVEANTLYQMRYRATESGHIKSRLSERRRRKANHLAAVWVRRNHPRVWDRLFKEADKHVRG